MEPAVNFFRLGMSVSAYGSIRVPRVGSTSRALLEHRWYIGGMKLASLQLELANPLLRKAYTRDAYAPYCVAAFSWVCAGPLVRKHNLISKSHSRALVSRFNSKSPVQPTVILESTVIPKSPAAAGRFRPSGRTFHE